MITNLKQLTRSVSSVSRINLYSDMGVNDGKTRERLIQIDDPLTIIVSNNLFFRSLLRSLLILASSRFILISKALF